MLRCWLEKGKAQKSQGQTQPLGTKVRGTNFLILLFLRLLITGTPITIHLKANLMRLVPKSLASEHTQGRERSNPNSPEI
jgi:hypothetical protein